MELGVFGLLFNWVEDELGMSERRRDFTRIKQRSNVFKCKHI